MSKKKQQTAPASGPSIEGALGELWEVIESGGVLEAEVQVAGLLTLPGLSGASARDAEDFVASLISAAARREPLSSAAAFYRLLVSLGSRNVKKMASGALRELTASGVYPPGWVTEIGKPVPGEAWRRYDVFGDDEAVVVTFGYGDARHGLLAMIDRTVIPTAVTVGISPDPGQLIEGLQQEGSGVEQAEQISLAEARRLLEPALARAASAGPRALSPSSATFLPVARSHVRRLPEPTAEAASGAFGASGASGRDEVRIYTAADRAAAVEDFLASPHAADAGDPQVARFWAQVLTGYSGRLAGEPPAQTGPRKLPVMLGHVASTFELTDAQRAGIRPAVTAWAKWAAEHQGLTETATEQLMASVPKALDEFDAAYDAPPSVLARAYASDLARSGDCDVRELAAAVTRRSVAIPYPARGERDAKADVADPAARAAWVAEEFGDCYLDEGMTRDDLVTAATRVVEELWSGEPAATWEAAQRLLAEGRSRHDVIHALVRRS